MEAEDLIEFLTNHPGLLISVYVPLAARDGSESGDAYLATATSLSVRTTTVDGVSEDSVIIGCDPVRPIVRVPTW